MRMWPCAARLLCRKHLLGEAGEIHKHRPSFVKRHKMDGRQGQIEPALMKIRHDELSAEMIRRGYKHNSPYELPDISGYEHLKIDPAEISKLMDRCPECRKNLEDFYNGRDINTYYNHRPGEDGRCIAANNS